VTTPDHSEAKYTLSGSSSDITNYFDTFFDTSNPGSAEYASFKINDTLTSGEFSITDGKLKVVRAIVGDTAASDYVLMRVPQFIPYWHWTIEDYEPEIARKVIACVDIDSENNDFYWVGDMFVMLPNNMGKIYFDWKNRY